MGRDILIGQSALGHATVRTELLQVHVKVILFVFFHFQWIVAHERLLGEVSSLRTQLQSMDLGTTAPTQPPEAPSALTANLASLEAGVASLREFAALLAQITSSTDQISEVRRAAYSTGKKRLQPSEQPESNVIGSWWSQWESAQLFKVGEAVRRMHDRSALSAHFHPPLMRSQKRRNSSPDHYT